MPHVIEFVPQRQLGNKRKLRHHMAAHVAGGVVYMWCMAEDTLYVGSSTLTIAHHQYELLGHPFFEKNWDNLQMHVIEFVPQGDLSLKEWKQKLTSREEHFREKLKPRFKKLTSREKPRRNSAKEKAKNLSAWKAKYLADCGL